MNNDCVYPASHQLIADAQALINHSGHFIQGNPAVCQLFGVTALDFIGSTPWDYSPAGQSEEQISFLEGMDNLKRAAKGEHHAFSWVHIDGGGYEFTVEVDLEPVEPGPRGHSIVTFRPI